MNYTSRKSLPRRSFKFFDAIRLVMATCAVAALASGCATSSPARSATATGNSTDDALTQSQESELRFVSYESDDADPSGEQLPAQADQEVDSLSDIEAAALASNPSLRRLAQEYEAARAKAFYVDKLPDPTIGTNVFGHPIETAAGAQRANVTISQMLPWLPRLDAQSQQACFEAAALSQLYSAERLRVIADIRSLWYRLFVIHKQIDINLANQELLESLIDVANSRVATGKASQGDIFVATLEFSKLEESLVDLRQQLATTKSQINRLAGLPSESPMEGPRQLNTTLPDWNHRSLRDLAWSNQPEIESARIRTQATRWGIEIARTRRRPDFTLNASWFAIDDNRPDSMLVDIGEDAWSLGAMMTIPLRHRKYDAIEQEARWKHAASHSTVEQVMQRYDSILLDLWEQAQAADETARLYQQTIIPEARRTLNADQASYANGEVEFDRVIQDVKNLLTLEMGYYRSISRLATAIARVEQATGMELSASSPTVSERDRRTNDGRFSPDGAARPPEPLDD